MSRERTLEQKKNLFAQYLKSGMKVDEFERTAHISHGLISKLRVELGFRPLRVRKKNIADYLAHSTMTTTEIARNMCDSCQSVYELREQICKLKAEIYDLRKEAK